MFLGVFVALLSATSSFAEEAFAFNGHVDFNQKEFVVTLDFDEQSSVVAKAHMTSETDYRVSLDVEHLKTPFFDLLSKIESSVEVVPYKNKPDQSMGGAAMHGTIWSQYSLVDYKPVRELTGRFLIKDKKLHLTNISFGHIKCNGYIGLEAPYKLDMAVNLYEVNMDDFLNFWSSNKKYDSEGLVSGEIKASGTFNRLALKGILASRNGFVQKLEYDSIFLNIEGVYPNMQIARSTISQLDGVSFSLDGPFDLSDKKNFKKQIKALTIAPLVSDSGSEFEWTIKRLEPENSDTTELKYKFRKRDALGTGPAAGDDIDMFGVERTRRF